MEALGRLFNVVHDGVDVEVNLRDAEDVTFLCVTGDTAAETFTLQESQDSAGTGAQNLAVIDRFYASTGKVGATAWTLTEQTAAATVSVDPGDIAAVHVSAKSLSDGFEFVDMGASGTGTVVAIVHDLNVQRDPAELPNPDGT